MRRVKPDNFFCYLKNIGVPISGAKLHVMDWLPFDEEVLKKLMVGKEVLYPLDLMDWLPLDEVLKRLGGWKGGSLPFGCD